MTASIRQLPSGNWRALVRIRGQYVSQCFALKCEGESWASDVETQIYSGVQVIADPEVPQTFDDLIRLHISDMAAVGRAPRRSKVQVLEQLSRTLGCLDYHNMDRDRLVKHG
ncbi:MAG: site-specific integrase, partial [Desulfobulbia bacterium]